MIPPPVTFDRPGNGSADSMPVGNGDLAANIWTEAAGVIGIYLSKADAWDENGRLVKIGRLRLTLGEQGFDENDFCQVLDFAAGEIRIKLSSGQIRIWIDADQNILHIVGLTQDRRTLSIAWDAWRASERELLGQEAHGVDKWAAASVARREMPLSAEDSALGWYCQNGRETVYGASVRQQSLGAFATQEQDPLAGLIFGARVFMAGAVRTSDRDLAWVSSGDEWQIAVTVATQLRGSPASLSRELKRIQEAACAEPPEDRGRRHRERWASFWSRSYLEIAGPGWQPRDLSMAYAHQRYLAACAGRGRYPIKFNGSLFTADWKIQKEPFDADYRRWGGAYWMQNTRLIYWPMLASGDFDLMGPFFSMFATSRDLLLERVRRWFGHSGIWVPETMYHWGALLMSDYGYDRVGRFPAEVKNSYMDRYWSPMLEIAVMMLEYHTFTEDGRFLEDIAKPFALSALEFYDQHFERDSTGMLRITNAHSAEQYHDVDDPLPDLAGLLAVSQRLKKLNLSVEEERLVERIAESLPELPTLHFEKRPYFAAARAIHGPPKNTENPELYGVFPFRIHGLGQDCLEVSRLTFHKRRFQETGGWRQDAIQAALLGLTETAAYLAAKNSAARNIHARFPTFWGPNFDWVPDQDHGSVIQLALQYMALQPVEEKLLLFPAWPPEWDVQIKLHAPKRTVVTASLKNRQLVQLEVVPPERRADVVFPEWLET